MDPLSVQAQAEKMLEKGFRFVDKSQLQGRDKPDDLPDVVMVANNTVSGGQLDYAVAFLYDGAPQNSVVHFALENDTPDHKLDAMADMGVGIIGSDSGGLPVYAYPFNRNGEEQGRFNAALDYMHQQNIPSVPIPMNKSGYGLFPHFTQPHLQLSKIGEEGSVKVLSAVLGEMVDVMDLNQKQRDIAYNMTTIQQDIDQRVDNNRRPSMSMRPH